MGIRTPAVTTARVTMVGGSVVGMSPVRMAQPMWEESIVARTGRTPDPFFAPQTALGNNLLKAVLHQAQAKGTYE